MATFPAIEPHRRSWSFGDWPLSSQSARGVGAVLFRHGVTPSGTRLTLSFQLLSQAQLEAIRAHYYGQRGGVIAFDLPPVVWSGPLSGLIQWRYISGPPEDHWNSARGDVSVELEAVQD